MNIQVYLWQSRCRGLSVIEHDILFRFSFYANRRDAACFPSIKTLERELETDRRHIERTIKEIENKGFIKKQKQTKAGRQTSNNYEFNLNRYFPKGDGEKKGLVILRKIKDYLANRSQPRREDRAHHTAQPMTDDIERLLTGGFKFAWLDEKFRRLVIAVESRTHKDYFLEHLEDVYKDVIGYLSEPSPTGKKRPVCTVEFLHLYIDKED